MLGDEGGVAAHWRLLAVILWSGGRETFFDKLGCVRKHQGHAPILEIGALLLAEPEARAKPGGGEFLENAIEIAHPASHMGSRRQSFE